MSGSQHGRYVSQAAVANETLAEIEQKKRLPAHFTGESEKPSEVEIRESGNSPISMDINIVYEGRSRQ